MNKNVISNLAKWFNQVGINFMAESSLVEGEEEARDLYAIGKDCWMMEYWLREITGNLLIGE